MASIQELRDRVAGLLRSADARFEERRKARQELMSQVEEQRQHFEALASELVARVVSPRIELLAQLFPNAGPVVEVAGGFGRAISLSQTEEFPAHARVEVTITHDALYRRNCCVFSPTIIPILMDYERDTSIEVGREPPDVRRLETFLDERIERFVSAYLSIRDPESVYQKDHCVTDPVCGMTFRRADAAAVLEIEGRKVFFCADSCRREFEAAPERYGALRPIQTVREAKWRAGDSR
jgi:YHS domain-containing protein